MKGFKRALYGSLAILLVIACGIREEKDNTPVEAEVESESEQSPPSADTRPQCASANQKINSISDAVALINALPKPVSLDCFIGALQRPLAIVGTESQISAQPAISRFQPRIFIVTDKLILSIVPGEQILEFGEIYDDQLSIKGEIVFPFSEDIAESLPYVNVGAIFNNAKRCGNLCHPNVLEIDNIGGAIKYASQIVRHHPESEVDIEELKKNHQQCTDEDNAACQLYQAIFSHGEMLPYQFDENIPFF